MYDPQLLLAEFMFLQQRSSPEFFRRKPEVAEPTEP
jgi:hypothetical protein